MTKVIDESSKVTLHFNLSLKDGTLAETTHTRKKPATLTYGDGSLPPNFEKKLLGLQAGDKKVFEIPCHDAFGEVDVDKIHTLNSHRFPKDVELEEGVVMSFEMPNGQMMPGVIHSIDNDEVVVDFNYPLAGHDITFEVDIISVE